jgi:tripartite motif-containing protein 71
MNTRTADALKVILPAIIIFSLFNCVSRQQVMPKAAMIEIRFDRIIDSIDGHDRIYNQDGIGLDSRGNLYVSDDYKKRILVFDVNGTFVAKWPLVTGDNPNSYRISDVAVGDSGNIYISCPSKSRIIEMDTIGNILKQWSTQISGSYFAGKLLTDHSGNIYLCADVDTEGFVLVFNENGEILKKIRLLDASWNDDFWYERNDPQGIAIDSKGYIYIADGKHNSIKKLNQDGFYVFEWGSAGFEDGKFGNPTGIAIDQRDYVYVLDMNHHQVQIFDTAGKFITKFGSFGSEDTQFNYPREIAVDNFGNIYICDTNNHRIVKYKITYID